MPDVPSERETQTEILRYLGNRPDCRIWRSNAGNSIGFVNNFVRRVATKHPEIARILYSELANERPVAFGVAGQADISGVIRGGRRAEVEVKSETGRQRPEQKNFQRMIESHGGLYILARDVSDLYSEFPKL